MAKNFEEAERYAILQRVLRPTLAICTQSNKQPISLDLHSGQETGTYKVPISACTGAGLPWLGMQVNVSAVDPVAHVHLRTCCDE